MNSEVTLPFWILQNTEPGFGYGPDTGEWVVAHSGDVEVVVGLSASNMVNMALDHLFARYNRGSGQEAADFPESMRSVSVGDLVVLGETTFVCRSRGWESVALPEGVSL